jgi:DNA-binding MarR family transcriptional regulator
VTILEMTPEGERTPRHIEKEKDELLEVLLKGFTNEERLQLLSMVKRLIKNTVQFARGDV